MPSQNPVHGYNPGIMSSKHFLSIILQFGAEAHVSSLLFPIPHPSVLVFIDVTCPPTSSSVPRPIAFASPELGKLPEIQRQVFPWKHCVKCMMRLVLTTAALCNLEFRPCLLTPCYQCLYPYALMLLLLRAAHFCAPPTQCEIWC